MIPSLSWHPWVRVSTALALWLMSALAAGQAAPAVPPFADELPATTAVCIWSDDARELASRWQKTALFELYAADVMRPFWDDVREKRGGLLPNDRLGLSWDDLVAVAAGSWILSYDVGADSTGTMLLVDVTGKEDEAAAALLRVQQNWKERGLTVRTTRRSSGSVYTAEGDGEDRFAFVRGARLCMTDQSRLVDHVLAPQGGESLASAELGKAIRGAATPAPRGALQFLLDPWRLARDAARSDSPQAAKRVAFYERHGFSAVQAVLGHVVFREGDHDAEFAVRVPVRFPLADAAAMLSFAASRDFALPPLGPRDPVGVSCFHWDLRRVFQAYGYVYDDVYGEDYAGAFDDLLSTLAEDPDGPQVDLRAELIHLLRSKITRLHDCRGTRTESNPTGRREVWMAESTNPGKSARAVEKFFAGDPDVTSSEVQGVRIWHSRTEGPLLGGDPENPLPVSLAALCVMDNHLVLATDRQMLRELADRTTSNVLPAGSKWQAVSDAPCIARGWRNMVEVGKNLHERLAQDGPSPAGPWEERLLWHLLSRQTEDGRVWDIEGRRLPAFSAIRDLFGFELMEAGLDPQGWRLQVRLTRPAGR